MQRDKAKEFVCQNFKECLPDGVPIPFDVLTAKFSNKRKSKAAAIVKLFTGDIAQLSTSNHPLISTKWLDLEFNFFWNYNSQRWETDNIQED